MKEVPEFVAPSPEGIFIGETNLRHYLEENDLGWAIRLREILFEMDWTQLREKYDPAGRRPIDPAILLGLIFYGMMRKQWSLRELEGLARRDVGAWWILGGLTPDHSTIGYFITRHQAELTGKFFEELTRRLLRRLKIGVTDIAGDGTVIEAMASRYRLLQEETLREEALKAREEAAKRPEPSRVQEKARRLEEAELEILKRCERREEKGRSGENTVISPVEPEACVQPLKNKTNRPSYKPSVLANEHQMIVGQSVEASNETFAIGPMLDQHERVVGERVKRLLLDAGYSNGVVFAAALTGEIDLLCPEGKADRGEWEKQGPNGKYGKSAFRYEVRVEFALHCMAYNLKRALRIEEAQGLMVLTAQVMDKNSKIVASGSWILVLGPEGDQKLF